MIMTIEDDIKILQSRKEEALEDGYKGFAHALGNAIDIMLKYQKIQEQVEFAEKENHAVDTARMIMIKEIINGE